MQANGTGPSLLLKPPSLLLLTCCVTQGVPSSPVTVVRGGAAVYHYDAQGKLLSGPDCYRAMGGRPMSLPPSPASKAAVQWPGDIASASPAFSNSTASSPVQGPGPLHAGRGGGGGGSGDGSSSSDAGTAEVHISLQQLPSRHALWQHK
jgi:hypothetical protein